MPVIRNVTSRTTLAERAELATGLFQRMAGLLPRASLAPSEALVFPGCRSIHTWFMRFPIDVMFCKTTQRASPSGVWRGEVVKIAERLPAFRMAWAPGADTVVELAAGVASQAGAQKGTCLEIA